MSKKHFEQIAAAIRSQAERFDANHATASIAFHAVQETANAIANVCADSNPRFDRNRFLTACGVNGGDK